MLDVDGRWLNTLTKNERLVEYRERSGGRSGIRGRGLSFFYRRCTKGTHIDRLENALVRNTRVRVLWKSNACTVVFKPAGLATQAPAPHPSLEAMVRSALSTVPPSTLSSDQANPKPYVAFPHRLDRPVSGVILVALSKRAANLLSQQFESRKILKRYLAWVQGDAMKSGQCWQDAIRKLPDEARCEIAGGNVADARPAITTVKAIGKNDQATLLELSPLTGRMHQLRVQSAHRGHPILGDSLYGSNLVFPGESLAASDCQTNASYPPIALHAWAIEFHDPANGKRVVVQADPPWPERFLPTQETKF